MAVIDCSTSLPAGDDYYSLSVIGSAGAAYADDHRSMQLVFGGGHPQALRTAQGDQAVLSAIQEFIDDVAKARAPSCGAAEWSRARRIATAVEQSLASSQSVSLMEGDTR